MSSGKSLEVRVPAGIVSRDIGNMEVVNEVQLKELTLELKRRRARGGGMCSSYV